MVDHYRFSILPFLIFSTVMLALSWLPYFKIILRAPAMKSLIPSFKMMHQFKLLDGSSSTNDAIYEYIMSLILSSLKLVEEAQDDFFFFFA